MSIKVEMVGALIPPHLAAGLSKEAVDSVIGGIAGAARAHWIKLASGLKSSFRNDYIRGIQPIESSPGMAVIALVGEIPHMLEDGSPRKVDLRKILLGSSVPVAPFGQKGKRATKAQGGSKPGYYRAIPFRHTTPGSTNQIGQPMGSAYGGNQAVANAEKLGKEVYGAAKQLTGSFGGASGNTNWGSRLDTADMGIPLLKPHHKTDIYSGMVKMEKTYEKATQNSYMTFRTISTRVTTGWIRKAIPAQHLAKQVADYVQKIAPEAFAAYFEGSK